MHVKQAALIGLPVTLRRVLERESVAQVASSLQYGQPGLSRAQVNGCPPLSHSLTLVLPPATAEQPHRRLAQGPAHGRLLQGASRHALGQAYRESCEPAEHAARGCQRLSTKLCTSASQLWGASAPGRSCSVAVALQSVSSSKSSAAGQHEGGRKAGKEGDGGQSGWVSSRAAAAQTNVVRLQAARSRQVGGGVVSWQAAALQRIASAARQQPKLPALSSSLHQPLLYPLTAH